MDKFTIITRHILCLSLIFPSIAMSGPPPCSGKDGPPCIYISPDAPLPLGGWPQTPGMHANEFAVWVIDDVGMRVLANIDQTNYVDMLYRPHLSEADRSVIFAAWTRWRFQEMGGP